MLFDQVIFNATVGSDISIAVAELKRNAAMLCSLGEIHKESQRDVAEMVYAHLNNNQQSSILKKLGDLSGCSEMKVLPTVVIPTTQNVAYNKPMFVPILKIWYLNKKRKPQERYFTPNANFYESRKTSASSDCWILGFADEDNELASHGRLFLKKIPVHENTTGSARIENCFYNDTDIGNALNGIFKCFMAAAPHNVRGLLDFHYLKFQIGGICTKTNYTNYTYVTIASVESLIEAANAREWICNPPHDYSSRKADICENIFVRRTPPPHRYLKHTGCDAALSYLFDMSSANDIEYPAIYEVLKGCAFKMHAYITETHLYEAFFHSAMKQLIEFANIEEQRNRPEVDPFFSVTADLVNGKTSYLITEINRFTLDLTNHLQSQISANLDDLSTIAQHDFSTDERISCCFVDTYHQQFSLLNRGWQKLVDHCHVDHRPMSTINLANVFEGETNFLNDVVIPVELGEKDYADCFDLSYGHSSRRRFRYYYEKSSNLSVFLISTLEIGNRRTIFLQGFDDIPASTTKRSKEYAFRRILGAGLPTVVSRLSDVLMEKMDAIQEVVDSVIGAVNSQNINEGLNRFLPYSELKPQLRDLLDNNKIFFKTTNRDAALHALKHGTMSFAGQLKTVFDGTISEVKEITRNYLTTIQNEIAECMRLVTTPYGMFDCRTGNLKLHFTTTNEQILLEIDKEGMVFIKTNYFVRTKPEARYTRNHLADDFTDNKSSDWKNVMGRSFFLSLCDLTITNSNELNIVRCSQSMEAYKTKIAHCIQNNATLAACILATHADGCFYPGHSNNLLVVENANSSTFENCLTGHLNHFDVDKMHHLVLKNANQDYYLIFASHYVCALEADVENVLCKAVRTFDQQYRFTGAESVLTLKNILTRTHSCDEHQIEEFRQFASEIGLSFDRFDHYHDLFPCKHKFRINLELRKNDGSTVNTCLLSSFSDIMFI